MRKAREGAFSRLMNNIVLSVPVQPPERSTDLGTSDEKIQMKVVLMVASVYKRTLLRAIQVITGTKPIYLQV